MQKVDGEAACRGLRTCATVSELCRKLCENCRLVTAFLLTFLFCFYLFWLAILVAVVCTVFTSLELNARELLLMLMFDAFRRFEENYTANQGITINTGNNSSTTPEFAGNTDFWIPAGFVALGLMMLPSHFGSVGRSFVVSSSRLNF